jgi:hypothetical protein
MSNLLKNLLIVLGLALALFAAYLFFMRGSEDDSLLMGTSGSVEAEIATQQLLADLNELKALKISGDIFSDPLFLSLKDFRTDLGEEATGRSNPFEPVQ